MVPRPDRREFTRAPATLEVDLRTADGAEHRGVLRDVSALGLSLSCQRSLPVGTECRVRLHVAEGDLSSGVEARARVVRAEGDLLALRFLEIPYEAFERLRAFLLRQAKDPGSLADELSDRLGFQQDD